MASIAPAVPLSILIDVIQISDDMDLTATFAQTLKVNFRNSDTPSKQEGVVGNEEGSCDRRPSIDL